MKRLLLYIIVLLSFKNVFSQGAPACPNVTTGATQTVCAGGCANLTSTLVTNYQTTNYSVASIPYSPYPYTGTSILVNTDDVWSAVENIGFNFCYFGNSYSQCLVGSNGQICFDLTNASGYDGYSVTTPLPSTTNMPGNIISAAFRDIDPVLGGNTYYEIGGVAPCRYAVISWVNIPLFDNQNDGTSTCDGDPNSTFQCVLYENTNFIDVYIGNSFSCPAWETGYGIVGIQNAAASVAICPPGRNCSAWTANNEAWRFTPIGAPAYTFNWAGPTGNLGTAQTTTVCPTTSSTYTATMVITDCDGSTFTTTATQQIDVTPGSTLTVNVPSICQGITTALTVSGATTYTWAPTIGLSASTGSSITATPPTVLVYTVTGNGTVGCVPTAYVTVVSTPTIAVTNATICAGATATLTASGSTSYTWSTAATTSTITASPITTTTYTVTGGASSCTATAVGTITVNPLPNVTVPPATICMGGTVTLTGNGATNYSWAPAIGLSSTVGTSVIANPLSTQNYTITGANATGCTNTVTTLVTVNTIAAPTATSNTPCANQTLSLLCLPNGLANYTWAGPNSYTSSIQNPIRTGVTAAAAGTYTVVVQDINNCINKTTINVIVNPLPIITASASPACLNQTINLSATNGDSLYSWSGPGGYTSPSQNPSRPNASVLDAGIYVVTVTDFNGCLNANTVLVSVYPLPTIAVTSATLCIASTETLTASGAANYTWTPATDLSAMFGNQVLIIPTTATNHTYTIIGQDMNGCVNTSTTTITVNDIPTVSITPAITKGCTPQCASYFVTNNPDASKYSWDFGNGQPSTQTSPTACFTVSGTYLIKLKLTDINECVNTATASVIAEPVPVPDFDYQPNPVSILAPKVQFINQSYVVGGATSYNWDFGDGSGVTSILKNPAYLYPAIGTYYVTLTDSSSDGCWASIVKPVYIEPDYTLYVPNSFSPNNDGINEIFKAQGEGILGFKMYVFDRWGNNIFTTDDINIGWDGSRNNKGAGILQEDVYVWKIDLSNVLQQGKTYSGTVTLLK